MLEKRLLFSSEREGNERKGEKGQKVGGEGEGRREGNCKENIFFR